MGELEVRTTDDPEQALTQAGEFLKRDPVRHNVVLTLLEQRKDTPAPGRYWTVVDGADIGGFAMQSPGDMPLLLTPMSRQAVEELATVIAADEEVRLPGVTAEASTAAAFAGYWSELVAGRVDAREGQRLYRLEELKPVEGGPGTLRRAGEADRGLLVEWLRRFCAETGAAAGDDPEELVGEELTAGSLYLWDDGGAVSLARATVGVAGVSRIGFVYTPTALRGRGYALGCVSALSERVRDVEGLECVLYTQLVNATSNRIYRRIGYRAVAEVVAYDFRTP